MLLRKTIYVYTILHIHEMVLAGEIEMDETTYGRHRKVKRSREVAGENTVFIIYQKVI